MFTNADIANNLKDLCDRDFDGSPVKFARALGMSYQSLKQYLLGRTRPGAKVRKRLAQLGYDVDFILTGRRVSTEVESNLRPVFAEVPAGRGRVSELPFAYEPAPPGVQDDGKGYWLRVKGNSMFPALRDGQLVFINPERDVKDKDFVVVSWDDHKESAIKQVHFKGELAILLSVNPLVEPITLKRSEISLIARICYIKL